MPSPAEVPSDGPRPESGLLLEDAPSPPQAAASSPEQESLSLPAPPSLGPDTIDQDIGWLLGYQRKLFWFVMSNFALTPVLFVVSLYGAVWVCFAAVAGFVAFGWWWQRRLIMQLGDWARTHKHLGHLVSAVDSQFESTACGFPTYFIFLINPLDAVLIEWSDQPLDAITAGGAWSGWTEDLQCKWVFSWRSLGHWLSMVGMDVPSLPAVLTAILALSSGCQIAIAMATTRMIARDILISRQILERVMESVQVAAIMRKEILGIVISPLCDMGSALWLKKVAEGAAEAEIANHFGTQERVAEMIDRMFDPDDRVAVRHVSRGVEATTSQKMLGKLFPEALPTLWCAISLLGLKFTESQAKRYTTLVSILISFATASKTVLDYGSSFVSRRLAVHRQRYGYRNMIIEALLHIPSIPVLFVLLFLAYNLYRLAGVWRCPEHIANFHGCVSFRNVSCNATRL